MAERGADHAAIDRLADELLPALVARLGTTGLGELEVREGAWRVRLRRPAGAERPAPRSGRAAGGRGSSRGGDGAARDASSASGGSGGATDAGGGDDAPLPTMTSLPDPGPARRSDPLIATAPAVGIFRARASTGVGTRVQAGDPIGAVDLLGVPVEVSAPGDGVVGALLVEDGDAVEYGQPLVALEGAEGVARAVVET